MKPVDIDGLFKQEIFKKLKSGMEPEALEEELPDLFLAWLDTPNSATGGQSPNAYFASKSPDELCGLLCDYVAAGMGLPDPLLYALEDSDSEQQLLNLLCGDRGTELTDEQREIARAAAAELLNQKESQQTDDEYIEILSSSCRNANLRAAAQQGLSARGEAVKQKLLAAVARTAEDAACDDLLDLLSALEPDERIYSALVHCFQSRFENRASCASFFARYGDARAVEVLQKALPGASYVEYQAMCEAIEALGGPEQPKREFKGDPDYEAAQRAKEKQQEDEDQGENGGE